ncbi:methyl-CpG-binding domain-containing protein 13-like isoform X1 [Arachis stenosperma]|uniref:methyl-CpG-binding domain-containing protein 13-like isoform X1 n=1 Tax=Arachis stenosperma TaxID=217475 RepID=UPI0025ACC50B|nr:methyl-CpG-binding domain-containing protein 13-like isoform X1 [Arachis stenosperma]XP_057749670.1 methyl-CpG-binding domain-containing protein 13-like isoform X1 [Arachis stenosperma]
MAEPDSETPEQTNTQISSNAECTPEQQLQIVDKAIDRPEWLPDGWTVDIRTRKTGSLTGSGYKCYIEPLNGYTFYSKPAVLRYLESKDSTCIPKKKKAKSPATGSPSIVAIEKSIAEDLPPGWIKEVTIRKNHNGIRKDPVYKDPVSGHAFRSKRDVQRYLASGYIRPSRKRIQDGDKLTPSPAGKRHKLNESAPEQQLSAGGATFDKSSLELIDDNSSRKGQDVNIQSGMMMVAPISVVKMHSLEDRAEDLSEIEKISDPDDMQEEHVGNRMENGNKKNHSNPSRSKEGEFNVHRQSSPQLHNMRELHSPSQVLKQLGGFDDDMKMNNSMSCEKTPKLGRKRSKVEISADLQQSEGVSAAELADSAPLKRESANKKRKSYKTPPITGDQLEKLRGKEMYDEKSEPQVSSAFNYSSSDPSLENATNNLQSMLLVENGPNTTGIATVLQTDIQKKSVDSVTGRSEDGYPQVRSNKSKKKKELKVPMRVSKRLAGLEPEVQPSGRALEYATRKSRKEPPPATATQISIDGASDHLNLEEETKLTCHASHSLKTEVLRESSNQSEKSCDAPTVPKEQLQKVIEAENTSDERSEPQLPVPFGGDSWSDPCLEFAFKTLTDDVLFHPATDILPVITPDLNYLPNTELHGVMITSEEAHDNSNQPQSKKELNMGNPSEPFPRQLENAPKFTTSEPYGDEGYTRNLAGESLHSQVGNVMPLMHHTVIHQDPSKEGVQVHKGESIIMGPPLVETGTVNHDNSKSQFCASFANSWSDPCLEFAFKTLTGATSADNNLQQPPNFHNQIDGGSLFPDFGSSSFSQSNFSFYHDIGVNSMPGQQSSRSNPIPPLDKASQRGYPEVDPQNQYSQFHNHFPR